MDYTVTEASMGDSPTSLKMDPASASARQSGATTETKGRITQTKYNANYEALKQDTHIYRTARAIAS